MKIFRQFSVRLSVYVIAVASIIFIAAFMIFFSYTNTVVRNGVIDNAYSILDNANDETNSVLQHVEVVVENMGWAVENYKRYPDSMYSITQRILKTNPIIVGSTIAFTPNYYKSEGFYFSPYSYRDGEEIISKQLGSDEYNYFGMEWYNVPYKSRESYWSEPYLDEGGGEIIMTTYSKPLLDKDGRVYAIITSDISLDWLNNMIADIQPYPNSSNVLLGQTGTYIVHKDSQKVLNESIFADMTILPDTMPSYIGLQMIDGKKGMVDIQLNDVDSYMFYAPINRTGWSLAIVCPIEEVFEELENIKIAVIIVVVLGMVLLLILCFRIIYRMTVPLRLLAKSAHDMADGDFTAKLPITNTKDEVGELRDSFEFMQHSLIKHMEELKQTASAQERIESELRIARDIQMDMVPKTFPAFPDKEDIDIHGKLRPAKEVGGDLYDFFIIDNKLFFAIGDVSGKGVPASLFMAVSRSLFRSTAAHVGSPSKILESMNSSISETNDSNMFITMFVGILDMDTLELVYSNAGHNAPVFVTDDSVKMLEVDPNIPVGLFDGFEYTDQRCTIERGLSIVLYTDGLTEAENIKEELYGDDKLLSELEAAKGKTAKEIVDMLITSVEEHAGEAPQSDDLTTLVIEIL